MVTLRQAYRFLGPAAECAVAAIGFWIAALFSMAQALLRLVRKPSGLLARSDLKSIVVVGASSGMGAALARKYARSGVTLALVARSAERLKAVAEDCTAKGAEVVIAEIDVTKPKAFDEWFSNYDKKHPTDLLLYTAGLLLPGAREELGPHASQADIHIRVVEVDALGAARVAYPVFDAMCERRRGQMVLVGSLSGYIKLDTPPGSYPAAKAAVEYIAKDMRVRGSYENVCVSLVTPGWVDTHMMQMVLGNEKLPTMISAEEAADIIIDGTDHGDETITFPALVTFIVRFLGVLPVSLVGAAFKWLNVSDYFRKY